MQKMFAFYSACHVAAGAEEEVYRKTDGKEVTITMVCLSLNIVKEYTWSDRKFVGIVTEFVRKGKANSYGS